MLHRYLFGPVTDAFADQHLAPLRQAGHCRTFSPTGNPDVLIQAGDRWEDVSQRWPADGTPDFVVLFLPYASIPACLWSAPLPLAGDSNLLWHSYRGRLTSCDLILADTAAVETFERQGCTQARVANLYGCGRSFLDESEPAPQRDIDVLFVGNLHPAVQRARLPWLGRLAQVADRCRVVIHTGVFGADYRRLLRRAKIVFNRSIRGEANQRAFEAAACGALLFQEAGNQEIARYFQDRRECVLYSDDNLEELLAYYLEHDAERQVRRLSAGCRTFQHCNEKFGSASLGRVLPSSLNMPPEDGMIPGQ